jgi:hypothetical protein
MKTTGLEERLVTAALRGFYPVEVLHDSRIKSASDDARSPAFGSPTLHYRSICPK